VVTQEETTQMVHITGKRKDNGEIIFETDYSFSGNLDDVKAASEYISSLDKLYPGLQWEYEKYVLVRETEEEKKDE
jgi:hypothetical protein